MANDTCEMSIYSLHCRPAFERIEGKLEKLEHSIIGNGKPGIMTRLDRLEQKALGSPGFFPFVQKNWLVLLVLVVLGVQSLVGGKVNVEEVASEIVKLKQIQGAK